MGKVIFVDFKKKQEINEIDEKKGSREILKEIMNNPNFNMAKFNSEVDEMLERYRNLARSRPSKQ